MEENYSGLIYATIALFLLIEDSSSGGQPSKELINLDTKFKDIDYVYEYKPDRVTYLLHRERDIRVLEAELNEALAVRHRLPRDARAVGIVDALIENLKMRERLVIRDFRDVYKKNRNADPVRRYVPGLLTNRAKVDLRRILAEQEWNDAYNQYKSSAASSSQASPSRASSDLLSFFETHRSIAKPDAAYVLGRSNNYLENEGGTSRPYAESSIGRD